MLLKISCKLIMALVCIMSSRSIAQGQGRRLQCSGNITFIITAKAEIKNTKNGN